ncbi:MAG: hypothetical protein MN733_16440 [Nitrososphaera sp.]|nr:hypothetical protein [Nitrososphaera sp.]
MTFVELLNESVIVRGVIALIVFGITGSAVVTGQELPAEWWAIVGVTGSHFFSGVQARQTTKAVVEAVRQSAR